MYIVCISFLKSTKHGAQGIEHRPGIHQFWFFALYPSSVPFPYFLVFLFSVLIFLFSVTFVSEADEALRLADHLFDLQNYDESVTEYKRFIFFNPEDKRVGDAFYKIGLAYRAERNWAEAIDALRMSIQKADSDKAKDERRIELGITLIASGNYNLAQLELLTVSEVSQYDSMRRKALYFQGVTDLYMFNWEDAQKRFNLFYSTFERQQRLDIDSLLVEARHLPSKSVRIAKILSTILPGAGQIYAGHWKNGLNALALNSLLATVCL
ncbi:MAG: hypothetical protein H8D67_21885, partial [Deltaproteobacteria bacterium]|nr:hypothetical protein [Deltaproteobacteria bacterium]